MKQLGATANPGNHQDSGISATSLEGYLRITPCHQDLGAGSCSSPNCLPAFCRASGGHCARVDHYQVAGSRFDNSKPLLTEGLFEVVGIVLVLSATQRFEGDSVLTPDSSLSFRP